MSGSGIIESDAPVDNTAYGRENGEWVATFAAEEMNLFVQQVNTNAQVARSAELAAKDAAIAANNAVNLVQQEAQNAQIARNAAEAAANNAAGSQQQANADALATQNALLATQQIKTDVQTLRDSTQNAATAASSSAAEAKHWADEAKRIADGIEPGTGGGIQYVPDTLLRTHSYTEELPVGNFGHYRFMFDPTYTGDFGNYLSIARLPAGGDGWIEIDVDFAFPVTEDGYIVPWLVLAAPEGESIMAYSSVDGPTTTPYVLLPVAGAYRAVRVDGMWRITDAIGCNKADLPTEPAEPPVEDILWTQMGLWPTDSMPKFTHIWPGQDDGVLDTFDVQPLWKYCTTPMCVDDSDPTSVKVKVFNRNTGQWTDNSVLTFAGQPSEFHVSKLYTPPVVPTDRILPDNPYFEYTHGSEHNVFAIIYTSAIGDWSWGILRGKVIGYNGSVEEDPDGEWRSHTETKITWELVCSGGRNETDDWPASNRFLYDIAAQPLSAGVQNGLVVAVGNYGLVCHSTDGGTTWEKGTLDKTCTARGAYGAAEIPFPENYVPSYNAVDVSPEGLWVAVDGQLANWAVGDIATGRPENGKHRALQHYYPYVDFSTGIVFPPLLGAPDVNPDKQLDLGNWKSVAISGTGTNVRVFMLPGSGDLMVGWHPDSQAKTDILMPRAAWGYPHQIKVFYNNTDVVTPNVVAILVIADKAVSKLTPKDGNSLNVTFTDVKGYPGKVGNFVTCYELSGDWHDKYAIVGANGTFNGAWQIPMADLTRV